MQCVVAAAGLFALHCHPRIAKLVTSAVAAVLQSQMAQIGHL